MSQLQTPRARIRDSEIAQWTGCLVQERNNYPEFMLSAQLLLLYNKLLLASNIIKNNNVFHIMPVEMIMIIA